MSRFSKVKDCRFRVLDRLTGGATPRSPTHRAAARCPGGPAPTAVQPQLPAPPRPPPPPLLTCARPPFPASCRRPPSWPGAAPLGCCGAGKGPRVPSLCWGSVPWGGKGMAAAEQPAGRALRACAQRRSARQALQRHPPTAAARPACLPADVQPAPCQCPKQAPHSTPTSSPGAPSCARCRPPGAPGAAAAPPPAQARANACRLHTGSSRASGTVAVWRPKAR